MDSKASRGNYGWKFNNSLLDDIKFSTDIRKHIEKVKRDFVDFTNPHLKWEFLKYEIRKFCIAFSKMKSQQENVLKDHHEKIILSFTSTDNRPSEAEYAESKTFLESYFDKKTASLRSKSIFYEENERSSKYFLNLEKKRVEFGIVRKLIKNDEELTDTKDILTEIHSFYSNLFHI